MRYNKNGLQWNANIFNNCVITIFICWAFKTGVWSLLFVNSTSLFVFCWVFISGTGRPAYSNTLYKSTHTLSWSFILHIHSCYSVSFTLIKIHYNSLLVCMYSLILKHQKEKFRWENMDEKLTNLALNFSRHTTIKWAAPCTHWSDKLSASCNESMLLSCCFLHARQDKCKRWSVCIVFQHLLEVMRRKRLTFLKHL